jgi:hypothetical protein
MYPTPLRPSVHEILFEVYSRPLHPEFFELLASRVISHPDFYLSVWLTHSGHVLSWNDGRNYLTEVTVLPDAQLPAHACLVQEPFRQERWVQRDLTPRLRYQSTFQMESLPPALFESIQDEIRQDGSKRGLFVDFAPDSDFHLAPLSHVTAEFRPGCLFLTAFHTFPEELVVLKTQSLIERRNGS